MTNRQAKRNGNGGLLKLGFYLYIGFCLFGLIWLRSAVVNLEYELGDLDKLRAGLAGEKKMMVARRASHYSTEKIESLATKRLGMTLPERDNVFFVKRRTAAAPYKASIKENKNY